MKLLAPLGLLGLIGIIILIIIYIIRPNFQQKAISSTYIWKLSLKYKKKRIPTSKLRNLLLILCQVLIIFLCAFLLSEPNKVLKEQTGEREIIAIIDSSASMRTKTDDYTRFERAAEKVLALSDEVFSEGGIVSVMVADKNPYYLVPRATAENGAIVEESVNKLVSDDKCSYGVSDIDGAVALCEDVLTENPDAQIYLFTDNRYSYVPSSIKVETILDDGEWNAGILNAYAEVEDNYFTFFAEVACYGRSSEIEVSLFVSGANATNKSDEGISVKITTLVNCPDGVPQTVVFRNEDNTDSYLQVENELVVPIEKLSSYQRVWISVTDEDSFMDDNSYYVYGGQKEVLKVQYASSSPNTFPSSMVYVLKNYFAELWDIDFDEVKAGTEPATEGYDLYIFEHKMPKDLPTDGACLLINPNASPSGSGIAIGGETDFRGQLAMITEETTNAVLKGVDVSKIGISRYVKIDRYDSGYEQVLSCNGSPVLLMKNEGANKIAIMAFSFHYSNLSLLPEWPILMKNIINCFFPATVERNSFEVNEKVTLNARGEKLLVSGNIEAEFDTFPATLDLDLPGTYDLSQTTFFDKQISESIYVRIPAEESDIRAVKDAIAEPATVRDDVDFYYDLLVYFALALVVIELCEWFLQSRDGM